MTLPYRLIVASLTLVVLSGCKDQEDSDAWMQSQNLPQIDSSRIRKGRLENLDDLKGIDYFRIGTAKNFYRSAFPTESTYHHSDTCHISLIPMDYGEHCNPTLVFRDDTLALIRLDLRSHNIRTLIQRLKDLYGEPNDSPFCIQTKADTTINFASVSPKNELADSGVYTEACGDILDTVTTYYGPPVPLYRDNIFHFSHFKESLWPDTTALKPAVSFHYYPFSRIQASWRSSRSLKMTIYREAAVRSFAGRDSSEHFLHTSYYVSLLLQ